MWMGKNEISDDYKQQSDPKTITWPYCYQIEVWPPSLSTCKEDCTIMNQTFRNGSLNERIWDGKGISDIENTYTKGVPLNKNCRKKLKPQFQGKGGR